MSVYGGSSGSSSAGDVGYVPEPVAPPHKSSPFVDWSSPWSIVTAPVRGAFDVEKDIGESAINAGKGIPAMLGSIYDENRNQLESRWEALSHGSLGHRATGLIPIVSPSQMKSWQAGKKAEDEGKSVNEQIAAASKDQPFTGALAGSFARTGADVEQVSRAGLNTAGQVPRLFGSQGYEPGGASVGELGTGAGLLGKTDFAKAAAQGGGGVLPKVLEDLANFAIVTGPVSKLAGSIASTAGEEAAARAADLADASKAADTAQKGAAQAIEDAQKNLEAEKAKMGPAMAAAQTGDPTAAAQWADQQQRTLAAAESLKQAQEASDALQAQHVTTVDAARQASEDAAARQAVLDKRAATAKLVHNLGQKGANSPFAQAGFAGKSLLEHAIEPAGRALMGTELADRYLAPTIERVKAGAASVAQHVPEAMTKQGRQDTRDARAAMEGGRIGYANEDAPLQRGFEETERPLTVPGPVHRSLFHPFGRGVPGMLHDDLAQAAASMEHLQQSAVLRQMIVGSMGEALGHDPLRIIKEFQRVTAHKGKPQYTPEQIRFAMEVFGPEADDAISERALEVRRALPEVRARYEEGPGAIQGENYAAMRGEEPAVRPYVSDAAREHADWNLHGTEPSVEHLPEWRKAFEQAGRLRARFSKGSEAASRSLERAVSKLEGFHVSPAEAKNPAALFKRLMEPAVSTAREVVGNRAELEALAADENVESRVRGIAQRFLDGKTNPDVAARDLATAMITFAGRKNISAALSDLIDRAAQAGMGEVPKGLPDFGRAVAGSELVGGGRERLRAGTAEYDRAVRTIAAGGDLLGRANAKLREPSRPPSPGQLAASKRLLDATIKLRDLQERAGTPPVPGEAVPVTLKEARETVRELRKAGKAWHAEQEKAIEAELREAGVKGLNPVPPRKTTRYNVKNRGGNERAGSSQVGQLPDWSNGGWSFASHVFQEAFTEMGRNGKTRQSAFGRWAYKNGYLSKEGLSPEQAVEQWGAVAHGKIEDPAATMEEWLRKVRSAYDEHRAALAGVEGSAPSSAAMEHAVSEVWGENEIAQRIAQHAGEGTLDEAARNIMGTLDEAGRLTAQSFGGPAERIAPGGDVHAALEADRQAQVERGPHAGPPAERLKLDEEGQRLYDEEVAREQARVQGDITLPNRERQLGEAPNPGRTQGRQEGGLLGRSQATTRLGEEMATRGDRAANQGNAILANTPELTQETVQRIAGPVGQLYGKIGAAEQGVRDALREYGVQQRALERVDAHLAEQHEQMLNSINAHPRPWRPIMQTLRNVQVRFTELADTADREIGPGAGDVYRAGASEAQFTMAQLQASGIDPQFIIGLREGEVENPGWIKKHFNMGQHLPTVRDTGLRKAGVGQLHSVDYEGAYKAASSRLKQQIDNEAGQHIINAVGGTLRDKLADRMGYTPDELAQMSNQELVKAMHDAHLSAWNASDWKGRAKSPREINLDTVVIPSHVWRAYAPYANEVFGSGPFLKTYDTLLRHWKAADLYLTGRWHTSLILGHAIMAMAGGGIDPQTYFHNIQIARRLERLRIGMGTVEDREFVNAHASPAQLEGLDLGGGHTSGGVVNRGYAQTEFQEGVKQHTSGYHPIEAGWKFQSHLDNINRTAVWLSKLDKGLDKTGLADFRRQYPDLAHLTDAQIKNEAAIRLSIRTIGDYRNMTNVEQAVIKRIIPFYPWLRHVTKLALNMAIHDPVRTAWMLHLGLMFSPKDSGVDWLGPAYDRGNNRWYTPPRWNPFESLGELPGASSSDSPFAALSPLLNTAGEVAAGYNLQQGKAVSRAPGTPDGPLLGLHGVGGPGGELGYLAGSTLPGVRAAREAIPALFGHPAIARYGTGQPVISSGSFIPSDQQQIPYLPGSPPVPRGLGPLVPLLGLGSQENVNAADIVAAQEKKDASNRKAAARYARQRAAAGGRK